MPENGQARLERIEAIIEALASSQADLEEEHRRLLRAQVVMTDSIRELADAQNRSERRIATLAEAHVALAEVQRGSQERLNALIAVVDDVVRRRPPQP